MKRSVRVNRICPITSTSPASHITTATTAATSRRLVCTPRGHSYLSPRMEETTSTLPRRSRGDDRK
ncbi:hypothetical protein BaRGS_00017070, partial [Batillaria attramentaria]